MNNCPLVRAGSAKGGAMSGTRNAFDTILNENVYMFDVDQTLVMWDAANLMAGSDFSILNPYDESFVRVRVHTAHVKLLKQMKARGRFIIVWSAGGVKWAEAVVTALGLDEYVDIRMTKPHGYVDDVPVEKWMNNHIFIPMTKDGQ